MTDSSTFGLPPRPAEIVQTNALRLLTILSGLSGLTGADAHSAVVALRDEIGDGWGKVLTKAGAMLETWYVQDSAAPDAPTEADYKSLGEALQQRFGKLSKRTEDEALLSLIFVMGQYARLDGDPLGERIEKGQTRIDRQHRRRVHRRLVDEHGDALAARLDELRTLEGLLRAAPPGGTPRGVSDALGVRQVVSGGAPGLAKRS